MLNMHCYIKRAAARPSVLQRSNSNRLPHLPGVAANLGPGRPPRQQLPPACGFDANLFLEKDTGRGKGTDIRMLASKLSQPRNRSGSQHNAEGEDIGRAAGAAAGQHLWRLRGDGARLGGTEHQAGVPLPPQ